MTEWTSDDQLARVIQGDALEQCRLLPDASVALIATDPPYFKCKDRATSPWDHQWKTADEYLAWLGTILDEFRRVLKPNGSLYLFASPDMAWAVEGEVRKRFNLLTNIRWRKPPFSTKAEMFVKEDLRAPFPASETILFAEHPCATVEFEDQSDGIRSIAFESIRQYLVSEFERAGMLTTEGKIAANVACGFSPSSGGMASRHYFSTSQWQMPTREHYEALRRLLNQGGNADYLRREYEDLRREFSATADDQYTDVWDFPTVGHYPGKHECEKPAAMLHQIVRTSSRPGDLVLDCFAGSGVTGQVAVELGRKVILVEQDPHWFAQACRRVQGRRPEPRRIPKPCPLFDQEAA